MHCATPHWPLGWWFLPISPDCTLLHSLTWRLPHAYVYKTVLFSKRFNRSRYTFDLIFHVHGQLDRRQSQNVWNNHRLFYVVKKRGKKHQFFYLCILVKHLSCYTERRKWVPQLNTQCKTIDRIIAGRGAVHDLLWQNEDPSMPAIPLLLVWLLWLDQLLGVCCYGARPTFVSIGHVSNLKAQSTSNAWSMYGIIASARSSRWLYVELITWHLIVVTGWFFIKVTQSWRSPRHLSEQL